MSHNFSWELTEPQVLGPWSVEPWVTTLMARAKLLPGMSRGNNNTSLSTSQLGCENQVRSERKCSEKCKVHARALSLDIRRDIRHSIT